MHSYTFYTCFSKGTMQYICILCLVMFPTETLELFNDTFFKKVQARGVFRKLYQCHIIPESVKNKIEKSDSIDEANHLLYDHLQLQATFCDLTTMTTIMSEAEGFAQMSNFGKDFETVLKSQGKRCTTCEKHSERYVI